MPFVSLGVRLVCNHKNVRNMTCALFRQFFLTAWALRFCYDSCRNFARGKKLFFLRFRCPPSLALFFFSIVHVFFCIMPIFGNFSCFLCIYGFAWTVVGFSHGAKIIFLALSPPTFLVFVAVSSVFALLIFWPPCVTQTVCPLWRPCVTQTV